MNISAVKQLADEIEAGTLPKPPVYNRHRWRARYRLQVAVPLTAPAKVRNRLPAAKLPRKSKHHSSLPLPSIPLTQIDKSAHRIHQWACLWFILHHPHAFREFFISRRMNRFYRLRPYQVAWAMADGFVNDSARTTGKTEELVGRIVHKAVTNPNKMSIAMTFRRLHLDYAMKLVIDMFERDRFLRCAIPTPHKNNIKRTPIYDMTLANGHKLYGASAGEGNEATNIKSKHPHFRYGDEFQIFPRDAWEGAVEARAEEGAEDYLSGVPDGRIDTPFFKESHKSGRIKLSVSRLLNPWWNRKDKKERIEQYGGENTEQYKQDIYGEWGKPVRGVWPMRKIAEATNHTWPVNIRRVGWDEFAEVHGGTDLSTASEFEIWGYVDLLLGGFLPSLSCSGAGVYCVAGQDYGVVSDPTEIVVFKVDTDNAFRYHCRVTLDNIPDYIQQIILKYMIERLNIRKLGLDAAGVGYGLAAGLAFSSRYKDIVVPVQGSEKVTIGWKTTQEDYNGTTEAVQEWVKSQSTHFAIQLLHEKRIWFFDDQELWTQLAAEVMSQVDGRELYRTKYEDHIITAFRNFAYVVWRMEMGDRIQSAPEQRGREILMPIALGRNVLAGAWS